MAYAQGSVVLAPATFKRGLRPYVVVTNRRRPFHGGRYTVAVVTSTERTEAVGVTDDELVNGELKRYPSYVSPWSLHVFPDGEIAKRVAQLDDDTTESVAASIRKIMAVL